MSETVVVVEQLGKEYRLGVISHRSLTRDVQSWWARIRGKDDPNSRINETLPPAAGGRFWALNDVSFEVRRGEILGILGRNGAGKSTLLKVLSRVTTPSEGAIRYKGRLSSLLEVGTGFHPELTGRENILLNGAILGMCRSEILRKMDEIIAFAEVEQFIDTPVKRYSSGMYVRLAFAVAAHLEPEILVIDEVLAVGDTQFQKKCIGKMQEIGHSGRTVLFVSHNMGAVNRLCTRGIVLDRGRLIEDSTTQTAVKRYLELGREDGGVNNSIFYGTLRQTLTFRQIFVNGSDEDSVLVTPASPLAIRVTGFCSEPIANFRITFSIYSGDVRLITQHDTEHPEMIGTGPFESEITVPPFFLRPGEYSISIGGYQDGMTNWTWGTFLRSFIVVEEWGAGNDQHNYGLINIPFNGRRSCSSR